MWGPVLLTSEDVGMPGSLLGHVEDVEYVGACATDRRKWGPGTLARWQGPGALARRGGGTGEGAGKAWRGLERELA